MSLDDCPVDSRSDHAIKVWSQLLCRTRLGPNGEQLQRAGAGLSPAIGVAGSVHMAVRSPLLMSLRLAISEGEAVQD